MAYNIKILVKMPDIKLNGGVVLHHKKWIDVKSCNLGSYKFPNPEIEDIEPTEKFKY
jgi:hypothetical protein